MPAVRPRITFTPDPRTFAALGRLSSITGVPKSSLVTEHVEMLADHFENLAGVLEQAAALTDEARETLLRAAGTAEAEMLPQFLEARRVMADLGRVIDDLGIEAEPPLSNTGATWSSEADRKVN